MMRSAIILTMSFAIGFALCLVVRAGLHHPYGEGAGAASTPVAPGPAQHPGGQDRPGGAPAALAAPPAPAAAGTTAPAPAASASAAAAAVGRAAPARAQGGGPEVGLHRLGVATEIANTVCPVCGAEVDASLPTSLYHGRIIGFGCRPSRCKEQFDADPERFGPAALANRKAE